MSNKHKFDELVNNYRDARNYFYQYYGMDGPKEQGTYRTLERLMVNARKELMQYCVDEWHKQKAKGIMLKDFPDLNSMME